MLIHSFHSKVLEPSKTSVTSWLPVDAMQFEISVSSKLSLLRCDATLSGRYLSCQAKEHFIPGNESWYLCHHKDFRSHIAFQIIGIYYFVEELCSVEFDKCLYLPYKNTVCQYALR
jgi:hypothetical protein